MGYYKEQTSIIAHSEASHHEETEHKKPSMPHRQIRQLRLWVTEVLSKYTDSCRDLLSYRYVSKCETRRWYSSLILRNINNPNKQP